MSINRNQTLFLREKMLLMETPAGDNALILDTKDKVLSGINICDRTRMVVAGIPPHMSVCNRVARVEKELVSLQSIVEQNHADVVEKLPEKIVAKILSNCQINGAVPLTANDLTKMLNDLRDSILSRIQNVNTETSTITNEVVKTNINVFSTWTWGSRLHPVPEGFIFPKVSVKSIWDLWYFGNVEQRIGPFRYLKAFDFTCKLQTTALSKARIVIKEIETTMLNTNQISNISVLLTMPVNVRDNVFIKTFDIIISSNNVSSLRPYELSYMRLYNILMSNRKSTKAAIQI